MSSIRRMRHHPSALSSAFGSIGGTSRWAMICAVCWLLLLLRGEGFVFSAPDLSLQLHRRSATLRWGEKTVSASASVSARKGSPRLWSHRGGGAAPTTDASHAPASTMATLENEQERDNHDEQDVEGSPAPTKKNHIQVSSTIHLPFSAQVAFDAFSDLPRQATWSPWLKSVVYLPPDQEILDDNSNSKSPSYHRKTKWTMRSVLGVSYSWKAVSTKLERPHLIEWESCQGLKNWGRVVFTPANRSKTGSIHNSLDPAAAVAADDDDTCTMQLTLTFVAPSLLARLFRNKKGGLGRMVERRIVGQTLRRFAQVVKAQDVDGLAIAPTTVEDDEQGAAVQEASVSGKS